LVQVVLQVFPVQPVLQVVTVVSVVTRHSVPIWWLTVVAAVLVGLFQQPQAVVEVAVVLAVLVRQVQLL
jgi:hypothetical protein